MDVHTASIMAVSMREGAEELKLGKLKAEMTISHQ
jgi:hypothetical protein